MAYVWGAKTTRETQVEETIQTLTRCLCERQEEEMRGKGERKKKERDFNIIAIF